MKRIGLELFYERPHPTGKHPQFFTNLVVVVLGRDCGLPPILLGAVRILRSLAIRHSAGHIWLRMSKTPCSNGTSAEVSLQMLPAANAVLPIHGTPRDQGLIESQWRLAMHGSRGLPVGDLPFTFTNTNAWT